MITSVEITDIKDLPVRYAGKSAGIYNGRSFEFSNGVNIVVGPNGSGKTALFECMSQYLLCYDNECSHMFTDAIYAPSIFNEDNSVKQGMKLHHDFNTKCFRYMHNASSRSSSACTARSLAHHVENTWKSAGESSISAMQCLFDTMFSIKDYAFPIKDMLDMKNKPSTNGVWKDRLDHMLKYYKDNTFVTSTSVKEQLLRYTVLIDEPDRNLDIYGIEDLYKMLSYQRDDTQLIVIIHNPMLIYKLYKAKNRCNINFIEMVPGYIDKILEIVSK